MKLKVYYLDDEIDLLEIFQVLFSTSEIEISTFFDPMVAMAAIAASPPDLFIIDYRLPKMSGDQIAQKLDHSIPKVLVTGELDVKYESTFQAVFSKPFNSKVIREFLNNQLLIKKNLILT